jgi:hypothetical protein
MADASECDALSYERFGKKRLLGTLFERQGRTESSPFRFDVQPLGEKDTRPYSACWGLTDSRIQKHQVDYAVQIYQAPAPAWCGWRDPQEEALREVLRLLISKVLVRGNTKMNKLETDKAEKR